MKTSNNKAKRKLTEIDFSSSGCHIALVSKEQGGPASLQDYALVMKATSGFSDEFIQKAQKIRVTMELPDFLEKFFHVYDKDAEVLAAMFGYVESDEEESGVYNCDSFWTWYYEKTGTDYYNSTPTEEDYKEYIASRLEGIEILKSIKGSKSLPDAISKLSEDTYLQVLQAQQKVEKAFAKEELLKSNSSKIGAKKLFETKDDVMPNKQEIETVEKAVLVDLQKAFDEQKVALEKAMATVAQFEAERKQAVEKARKEALAAVVKDADKTEALFKAVGALDQEGFDVVVKMFGEVSQQVEKSDLFKETGVTGEGKGQVQESAVAKALKAQLKKSAEQSA